jgi:hypothetical protein
LEYATQADCFELRHADDDSEDSEVSDQEFFKPNFELPALEQEQEIGEFESLVLVLKKQFRNKRVVPK